ncbi:MAG: nucleotidyl transferase AbiEii/AbiGii toxin family protein [Chlamydiales bacterium]|nr:nucleotidyl transferase AbiEii/AbiGii toxin family protein [Chlamydiia bacterium]MCP5506772.1 nucleotidyl transferase AbiEii/AbiGii toxin family protein [Chlamydiales bacterium]
MNKTFSSPASFRQSLESRLKTISKETGIDLQRVRRKVAFERFLARLFSVQPYLWVLKGGYALEVRFEVARATKDLDLGTRLKIAGTVDEQRTILSEKLQERVMLEAEDHFQFRVEPTAKLIESAPYGGFRFPIRSMIAGRLFVAFSLDVGFGDAITPPIEEIEGSNWLDFCGIPPARFEAISLEQQFAEKIHAMSVDRGDRENSRVKDLVDVLLLIETGLDKERVSASLENTFRRRGEIPVPHHPPNPPDSWRQPFSQMAADCGLDADFDVALASVSAYWSGLHQRGN